MAPLTHHQLARHAERFGPEAVFEAACDASLPAEELGHLSLRLQRIYPEWRLSGDERKSLALGLLRAGTSPKNVCEMAQLGKTRVYQLRRELRAEES
jgi:hypothetical protein